MKNDDLKVNVTDTRDGAYAPSDKIEQFTTKNQTIGDINERAWNVPRQKVDEANDQASKSSVKP